MDKDDKAPLFGKWKYGYIAVLLFLVLLIVLFYLFTLRFPQA